MIDEQHLNETRLYYIPETSVTGIGYMIPVIVAPGIVMGVAQVAASMLGLDIKSAEALGQRRRSDALSCLDAAGRWSAMP